MKKSVRHLDEIRQVLYDKNWAKKAPDFEVYYMYRGVKKKNGLRYDITVIPPKMLGKEFVKTKGHSHLGSYGELYLVLEGKGIYLMQKFEDDKIKDVYAVKAKKGEVIIIPPYFGHVTINPSKTTLKTANWISEKCQSDYNLFLKKEGACYYYTKEGWIKNRNYKRVPKLHFKKPLKRMPKNLDFLK